MCVIGLAFTCQFSSPVHKRKSPFTLAESIIILMATFQYTINSMLNKSLKAFNTMAGYWEPGHTQIYTYHNLKQLSDSLPKGTFIVSTSHAQAHEGEKKRRGTGHEAILTPYTRWKEQRI